MDADIKALVERLEDRSLNFGQRPDPIYREAATALTEQAREIKVLEVIKANARALSGAYWRLNKYGFICSHNADDPEHEAEAVHWRAIADQASETIRHDGIIVAPSPEPKP